MACELHQESRKHAYLILAHKNWDQVSLLIQLLDDRRNDIYIHFDKSKEPAREIKDMLIRAARLSTIYFTDNVRVRWGDFGMVQAELNLLGASIQREYQYYHLLSGMDLPLKSQDEIHAFFDLHEGLEFVSFSSQEWHEKFKSRYEYYWPFYIGNKEKWNNWSRRFNRIFHLLQKLIGINRIQNRPFGGGSQWFSITHGFAQYVVGHGDLIHKWYKMTFIPDESFLQSLVIEAGLKEQLFQPERGSGFNGNMRLTDWNRGNPYTYRSEDYLDLINSKLLFARKFDETVDAQIIHQIFDFLKQKKEIVNERGI